MSYQDTLLTWHDFYLACAAASATFAGLLFVALSLHLRIVVTHPEARESGTHHTDGLLRRPACIAVPLDACRSAPANRHRFDGDFRCVARSDYAAVGPRYSRPAGTDPWARPADFEIRAEHARMHCGRCTRRCLLLGNCVDRLQRPCGDSRGVARRRRAEYVGPAGDRRRQEAMKLTGKFGAAEDLQRRRRDRPTFLETRRFGITPRRGSCAWHRGPPQPPWRRWCCAAGPLLLYLIRTVLLDSCPSRQTLGF